MPRQEWTCPVCTQSNEAGTSTCIYCRCPIKSESIDIVRNKQLYANEIRSFKYDNTPTDDSSISDSHLLSSGKKSLLVTSAIFLVLIPTLLIAVGYVVTFLIPGCIMGGSNGAHGCGVLNPFVELVGFWGMIYFVLGIGAFFCVLLIGSLWQAK